MGGRWGCRCSFCCVELGGAVILSTVTCVPAGESGTLQHEGDGIYFDLLLYSDHCSFIILHTIIFCIKRKDAAQLIYLFIERKKKQKHSDIDSNTLIHSLNENCTSQYEIICLCYVRGGGWTWVIADSVGLSIHTHAHTHTHECTPTTDTHG